MNKDILIANKIARAVNDAGGCAYYVGGCVRDKLLGIPSGDLDIEVHGITPDTLDGILDQIGHTREVGLSFGIWSLDDSDIDIAMPRLEEATGRGHRDFKTHVDPYLGTEKASRRRDFTVNAIMENVLTHELVDHYGGQTDLKNGILRHVNDESFAEDPLRVLRGAGFAARFGFTVADETLELFRCMQLEKLSCERVFGELAKALLKADKPSVFFDVLKQTGQLDTWFPEIKALIGVPQSPIYHAEGDVYNHTMLVLDEAAKLRLKAKRPLYFMLSALCHDLGKTVTTAELDGKIHAFGHETEGLSLIKKFLHRLTNESDLRKYVLNMTKLHMRPNMLVKQNAGKKSYNRMFDESIEAHDLLLLAKADFYGSVSNEKEPYESTEERLHSALDEFHELMSRPYVAGADLIDAGLTPGEDFKRLLDHAHKLRLAGVPKKEALAQVLAEAKKS
ncbi:MAG: HD domain-containing protein [Clostridia bacterium]|nr:HD domain-containing protein [Clostridia bacterium]